MRTLPPCPQCDSIHVYADGNQLICPICAHEWNPETSIQDAVSDTVHDANGTLLADGDTVTVIKDLKVKGSSAVVKVGTKIKNIRLRQGDHNIDCKVPGIGQMGLKSEFVKKVID